MSNLVLLAESEGLATLVLNRPQKLNAFDEEMGAQLLAAVGTLATRPDIGALVITGAGRAFCAGGDVADLARLKRDGLPFEHGTGARVAAGSRAVSAIASLPFPTIASVNGPAAGGGCNLALACDLRVASDRASFAESFVRIGMHTDWGGSYFLPRLVGLARALELCWLGDTVDAGEALRIGLVNRVVPHDELAEETRTLASRLVNAPRTSVRAAKHNLRASFARTLGECLEAEYEAQRACWRSADSDGGVRAFVEKRTPVFGAPPGWGDEAVSASAQRFE